MQNRIRLISGRVVTTNSSNLASDRYQYLDLASAEPNLGTSIDGSILSYDSSILGGRKWITQQSITQPSFNVANSASANTIITQGVDATQNTRLNSIETINSQQNTNIVSVNQFAASAYNSANTNATNLTYLNSYAESAYAKANTNALDIILVNQYAASAYNSANTIASDLTSNVSLQSLINLSQNTRLDSIETINTNQNTTIGIIQGVDLGQNTRLNLIEAVNQQQNTAISIIQSVDFTQNNEIFYIQGVNLAQNTAISIIQGVNETQNTRINSIETVNIDQNTAISIIQGVDLGQNATITAINQFTQAAYNTANGANGLAAGAYNQANVTIGVDATQNTKLDSIETINTNQNNAITIIQGVDLGQNTRLNSIETINANQNNDITIIQGVDLTQNTRLTGLESNINIIQAVNLEQNTAISIIQGVDLGQNATITAVNQFAQSAYDTANGANGLAAGAYNQANVTIGVDATQNTRLNSIETINTNQNTSISIIQGVDTTQNVQIFGLQGVDLATNTAISIIQGVNLGQNATITAVNQFAQSAYDTANGANGLAAGAFDTANTKFNSSGGTISGSVTISANNNLTVTGNLTVLGTSTIVNTQTFTVNDPMIILGLGNYITDAVDIGFAGHYNDGTNAHTGFIRDYATKEYFLFQGYTPELTGNNNIDINHASFSTANLNAGFIKGNVVARTAVINGIDFTDSQATQNTRLNSIETVNNNQNTAISIIQGVDLGQNATITAVNQFASGAFNTANGANGLAAGAYNLANTTAGGLLTANAAISVIQGVDLTQNTRLNSIETVNNNQNTTITAVNQFTQSAYNTANNKLDLSGGVVYGNVTVNNLTANGVVISPELRSTGGTTHVYTSDIGIVSIDVNGGQTKFFNAGVEVSGDVYAGTFGGNRVSLGGNEAKLQSLRTATVQIQTGTDGSVSNTWTFNGNKLTFPDNSVQNTAFTGVALDQFVRDVANSASANTIVTQGVDAWQNSAIITLQNSLITINSNSAYSSAIDATQNTRLDSIETINTNQNTSISIIQGVDLGQNATIIAVNQFAQSAYDKANSVVTASTDQTARDAANGANGLAAGAFNQANTTAGGLLTANSNISIIQGVNLTQNTRLNSIETINLEQNTAISIIQGVDLGQNTTITNVNQFAAAAFDQANTANTRAFNTVLKSGDTMTGALNITSALVGTTWGNGALNVNGNIVSNNAVYFGGSGSFGTANGANKFANSLLSAIGNSTSYAQAVLQNGNSGVGSSTDFVATADNGTDTDTFINMGINSSSYNQAGYELTGPNDGYVYVYGNTATGGGNLVLSTFTPKDIVFSLNGQGVGNEYARFQYNTGLKLKNLPLTFADNTSQNTAYNPGIDATQNTQISGIQGVDVTQNTRLNSIETINTNQNTTISIIQGVDVTQNTRLGSIETINTNQNTTISIIQGVDLGQNATITAVNQFAQSAYNKANTGAVAVTYSANSVIFANSAGFLSNTSNLQFFTSNNTLVINGTLAATSKSFSIPHPTKEGKQLRYGSLEGPENGVYVRGRLFNSNIIELPEYWTKLIDPNTITVNLTPVGNHQKLFVEKIENNCVYVGQEGWFKNDINCFYVVYAERSDIEKLVVES